MKTYDGHLYETVEDWHPVVIRQPIDVREKIIRLPAWLSQYCPDNDYDAWCMPGERLEDPGHRTLYFFRDEKVATLFALRWT